MKSPSWRVLPLLASFALSGAAWASVDNTHHDMTYMTGQQEKGICSFCHIPHSALSDQGLLARESTAATTLGPLGSFCYSCHDGTVIPTAMIEAPDGTVGVEVLLRSHGNNLRRLDTVTGGMEGTQNLRLSGLIAADPATDELPLSMDCKACHDVHSNKYPPFLRVPLEDLCQKCHSGVDMLGMGRWTKVSDTGEKNNSHPVDMPVADSGLDRVRGTSPEQSFHAPDPIFNVPMPGSEELNSRDTHWDMGGHLFGEQKTVNCSTCHSAHMPAKDLLVARGAQNYNVTSCMGCHGNGADPENPGTTPYGHPVFQSSLPPYVHEHASHAALSEKDPNLPAVGVIELFVNIPSDFPLGVDGTLLCTTCHTTHGGVAGTKVLRSAGRNWTGGVICGECHGTGTTVSGINMHHSVKPNDLTAKGWPAEIAWSQGPGKPGDLKDGLQCTDCHVGWAKSGHNW